MTSGDHHRQYEPRTPNSTPRELEGAPPSKPPGAESGLTKLLFAFTKRHRGKAIELDSSHDTMRVLGPTGEELAVVDSEVALDHLLGVLGVAQGTTLSARPRETASREDIKPGRAPLRIAARSGDGRDYEGLCPAVGPNALFMEVTPAPAPGAPLSLAIAHPDDASRTLRLKGTVAWVCQRPDEFGFGPGVGVICTWRAAELSAFLSDSGRPLEPRSSAAR